MKRSITVKINGVNFTDEVEDRLLLVWFIRDLAGLTGTHVGCDTGHCGACTVLMDRRSVKSCSILAVQADNAAITTVEDLAKEGKMHPLQDSFRENFAVQCGYCTPGLLMSSFYLLSGNEDPSEAEIMKAIHGNLCRCEGYPGIIRAIKKASEKMKSDVSSSKFSQA
ncbi:MAG: 2Fe-2S iron-sulfur cluster-binding protein [Nitrososphaerales archaeon]